MFGEGGALGPRLLGAMGTLDRSGGGCSGGRKRPCGATVIQNLASKPVPSTSLECPPARVEAEQVWLPSNFRELLCLVWLGTEETVWHGGQIRDLSVGM